MSSSTVQLLFTESGDMNEKNECLECAMYLNNVLNFYCTCNIHKHCAGIEVEILVCIPAISIIRFVSVTVESEKGKCIYLP